MPHQQGSHSGTRRTSTVYVLRVMRRIITDPLLRLFMKHDARPDRLTGSCSFAKLSLEKTSICSHCSTSITLDAVHVLAASLIYCFPWPGAALVALVSSFPTTEPGVGLILSTLKQLIKTLVEDHYTDFQAST